MEPRHIEADELAELLDKIVIEHGDFSYRARFERCLYFIPECDIDLYQHHRYESKGVNEPTGCIVGKLYSNLGIEDSVLILLEDKAFSDTADSAHIYKHVTFSFTARQMLQRAQYLQDENLNTFGSPKGWTWREVVETVKAEFLHSYNP